MGLNPKGRDWGPLVNWDDLGKSYAGFIIAWTIILLAGGVWIVNNRNLPSVRVRNVVIPLLSVGFLHIYLVKILLAYTTNGHFSCAAEFWIMNIYLPFGIALFQANLAELHSVSEQQQKLIPSSTSVSSTSSVSLKSARKWRSYWNDLPSIQKSYIFIAIGMLVQVVVTAVLFATTPELQGNWSSYGPVSRAKGQALCRRSLRWIPSAFWQLFWSWFYGLFTLYKIRNIRDTHYWRLGTWLCVISGLPGTPLWIAALFCDAFKPVNIRWVPPMWLAPGIVVMQFVTIFFPIYEEFESRRYMRKTFGNIKAWENQNTFQQDNGTSLSTRSSTLQGSSITDKSIFSMASLEKALDVDPLPLLHFAANRDFTAENIIFLMRVKEWRQAWATAPCDPVTGYLTDAAESLLFRLAVETYHTCIDQDVSQFPINIEASIRVKLDSIFEPTATGKRGRSPCVDSEPFLFEFGSNHAEKGPIDAELKRIMLVRKTGSALDDTYRDAKKSELSVHVQEIANLSPHPAVAPLGPARAKVRVGLDVTVFDAAEASIKYLVLTNTWRKFAQIMQSNSRQQVDQTV